MSGPQLTEIGLNALQGVANNALSAITDILPIALPVMGAIVVVSIGVKVFKSFVK